MTVNEVYNILLDKYNRLMSNRISIIFQRKSDQKFLGTDLALKGFLDNPELYNVDDNPNLNEIVVGLFKNQYNIIQDSTNSVVSIG